MDPFTEKLLERTRARRENLQKKMAERPNAANRAMVKRPLADTNSLICEPAIEKVPQSATKPSPSKRKCSGENVQSSMLDEENKEPLVPRSVAPLLQDPSTDKKPPVGRTSLRNTPSMEKTQRSSGAPQVEQVMRVEPGPAEVPVSSREEEMDSSTPQQQRTTEEEVEESTPSTTGMRSRLHMLAQQRKCWDSGDASTADPDCTPMSMMKRPAEAPSSPAPSVTSGGPVGRRGRLANLAATIGSWEDDLSHANIPKHTPQEKPAASIYKHTAQEKPTASIPKYTPQEKPTASIHKPAIRETCVKAADHLVTRSLEKNLQSGEKSTVYSPVKASRVVPPSPQKTEAPATQSPQKIPTQKLSYCSPRKDHPKPIPQSPLKNQPIPQSPLKNQHIPQSPLKNQAQSPLKNQALSRPVGAVPSPHKPEIRAKPADLSYSSAHETTGTPGVKSFLERFGERCQERSNLSNPAGGSSHPKTPITPSVTPSVTPNTRLVQEKLRAAQSAKTTSADLTQRHKMERESELAQIRNRFQRTTNMWKNKDERAETITDTVEPMNKSEESEAASCQSDEPTAPSVERTQTPTKSIPSGFLDIPPSCTSSPLKTIRKTVEEPANQSPEEEKNEEEEEKEMNVDGSINSAVINELFEGVLEQSEPTGAEEEEEEEDPLNISSMSLLAPVVETVAAVSKSPEGMMTSTPASSFMMKNTPERIPIAKLRRSLSSDSINIKSPEHRLPYSIDAYRSTRVKDTDRPSVKQVIVRKEDVSQRAEEPRVASLFSIKQKMKILTNEMNLQQTVIHQASQALNCCTDEEHGKGSQVEAEAERLLLVATEKRSVVKAELERLKVDPSAQRRAPAPDPSGLSASKGSITLQELRLPLKADFVCSTANKPESTKHSFFVMIRAGPENTVATPLASTHRGLSGDTLTFPTKFTMPEVSSDFQIMIEVYCLVQKREMCPDKKKKINKSKAITPKRFLAITKSAQTPVVASPGGPNAVRSSNFILVGSHRLSLSSIGKNKFQLEKVPFLCPLEGYIYLKIQCEVGSKVEEKGFLTMFEDVSGFGAWHRRWCVLSGYCISYWTYPDDEKRKNPIGRINLANCTSQRVEPANREFCARPHTIELITVRPQREDDRETLVSQCLNTMCVTKNWLSADTKDERNLWMKKLNQILMDLRMWQPESCLMPL